MSFPILHLPPAHLVLRSKGAEKQEVLCLSRHRYVALTPEEWVRQHFIAYLTSALGYPQGLVAAEVPVTVNGLRQRADIVVYSRAMRPLMIVECKAPSVELSQTTLNQACRYLGSIGSAAVVLTNGMNHYCVRLCEQTSPCFVASIPTWQELCSY